MRPATKKDYFFGHAIGKGKLEYIVTMEKLVVKRGRKKMLYSLISCL